LNTYVSTDSQEIAEDAEKYGAKILWRAPHLSSDASKTIDTVIDAIQQIKISTGKIILLQPTSPLRTAGDICEANSLYKTKDCQTVISITECEHHPYKTLVMEKSGIFLPLKDFSFLETPRQKLPKCYKVNGAIYINKIEQIRKFHSFFAERLNIMKCQSFDLLI